METSISNPVSLTENAVKELKRIKEANNITAAGLRIGVTGGGCAGFSYTLNFDNEIKSDDQVYEVDGIKVIVDLKSALYLNGTTVDYVSSLTEGGFKFMNPQAKGSCGCGSSFSA